MFSFTDCPATQPTSYGHTKYEVQIFLEFFHLQSNLDFEFFSGSVWARTFFGHAKFEVNNFLEFFCLQSTVGVFAPTFFGHAEFDFKNFWEFFHLQSTLDSEFFRQGT